MKNKITSSLAFIVMFLFLQVHIGIAKSVEKPNIVIVMTDQQFADAMSCVMGTQYLHTPNMDKLVENGVRFTKAYSPNPLCQPMRTSMMTGTYSHQNGILTNGPLSIKNPEKFNYIGTIFKDAGYETGYFGKWHVAIDIQKEKALHGFDVISPNSTADAKPAVEFISKKHDKSFIAVASFLSPHEICEWSRKQVIPGDQLDSLPPLEKLPSLKTNFATLENETDIMTFMRKSYQAHHTFPVANYTNTDWRRLLWGYYRLIERADAFVGEVFDAVEQSGQAKNTLIVFLSDHGDCAGSHHWNQKTVFYDESSRVPLVIKWEGKTAIGTSDALVNTGIDMIPTLCDFAEIKIPEGLPGKSLMGPATGNTTDWKREFVVSENHMVQCQPVDGKSYKPQGRMVRSERYKYCLYSEGDNRESLIDMQFDPQEMVNQAGNPLYKEILEQHRNYLKVHAESTGDKKAQEMLLGYLKQ